MPRAAGRALRLLCIALVTLAASAPARALDPARPFHQSVRDTWGVGAGLPQASVMALAQTPDGYLRIATQQGLARFDGVSFRTYTPRDTPALPDAWITRLFVDSAGTLWIGTLRGAARRAAAGFEAVSLHAEADDATPLPARVQDFAELEPGVMLLTGAAGLFRQTGATRFVRDARVGALSLNALAVRDGTVYFGLRGGLGRLGSDGYERIPIPLDAAVLRLAWLAERWWLATGRGLVVWDGESMQVPELPAAIAGRRVNALGTDGAGDVWVGTDLALLRFRGTTLVESVPNDATRGIANVYAMLVDHEGNFWLGSYDNGLHRLWDGWVQRYSTREGLHDPVTWGVAADGDGLLVGTRAGLARFDGGRFSRVSRDAALDGLAVTGVLDTPEGRWIGTITGLYLERGGRVRPAPGGIEFGGATILGLERDAEGTLWVATAMGVWRSEGAGFRRVPFEPDSNAALVATRRAPDGAHYAAGDAGLFVLDGARFRPVPLPVEGQQPLINALLVTPAGELVLGDGAGRVWLGRPGVWAGFGSEDGLPERGVGALALDERGQLWVSAAGALYRVPLAALRARAADRSQPLGVEILTSSDGKVPGAQHTECCNYAGIWSALVTGDAVWLPTSDGLVRVPTGALPRNTAPPPVHVERVRHGGTWREVAGAEHFDLPASDRDLEFDFTALSFRDPRAVRLEYRLEGYDPDWRVLEDPLRRRATYTNLPHGAYRFTVRASNEAGVWSTGNAALVLRIAPLWHETLAARGATLLALLLAGLAVHRWRVGALERDRLRLETLVGARTAELEQANAALHEASETDALTGLKNRRYLYQQLPSDLAQLARQRAAGQDRRIGLVLADLDEFKRLNDQHGHAAGDAVLRGFAALLRQAVRQGDYVVRWGGEEFLVVLRDLAPGGLPAVTEHLRQRVASAHFDANGAGQLQVTASLGGVEFPSLDGSTDALGWEAHVELADRALYAAKDAGRNTWAWYRGGPRPPAPGESRLDALIGAGALELVRRA
jgi:diguanylate cyclase (GGDEF)-like protein